MREAHQRATLDWRRHFRAAPDEVVGLPPPVEPACLDDLADLVSVAVESVIVVSNSIGDPKATGRHILLLRTRVKRLFQP